MALTLTYTPPTYSSAHDDVIFTVQDTDKVNDPDTYPEFKFIADVYVGSSLVARIKRVADPVTGFGVFNIGMVLRNYFRTAFNPTLGELVAQQLAEFEFFVNATVHFGEEWGFVPTYDIVVDSQRQYFNHYNGRLFTGFTTLAQFANKVTTNRPARQKILSNSFYHFIPYFSTVAGDVPVTITPVGGGSVYSTTFTTDVNMMTILNLSPQAINAMHAGTITPSTRSYAISIGAQTYYCDLFCEPIYTPFQLHWMNQYGGFDSKIFSKVSRETRDINKSSFGKLGYIINGSGAPEFFNANNVYNEKQSTYASSFKQKYALNSDLLADEEYGWLAGLIQSPLVYVEQGGVFFPIQITDTTYELKKVINDDLTNLLINIEFGQPLNTQFR